MVYCVAVGCTNGQGSGKSFFSFPKEKQLRDRWIRKVSRQGRKRGELWSPTKHSKLCGDHFEPACFSKDLAENIGYTGVVRPRLKTDAVPTIFRLANTTSSLSPNKKKPARCGAFAKRRRQEMVDEMLRGYRPKESTIQPACFKAVLSDESCGSMQNQDTLCQATPLIQSIGHNTGTTADYDEELRQTKEEKKRQRLGIVYKQPRIVLHRADVNNVHGCPGQQEPEPPHIKEEKDLVVPHIKVEPENPHIKVEPENPHIKVEPQTHHIKVEPQTHHIKVEPQTHHIKVEPQTPPPILKWNRRPPT
ncbi:uncharacterized protein LOC144010562 isoform X2 [Festucalex cinctus]